jgi:hypothetical protein
MNPRLFISAANHITAVMKHPLHVANFVVAGDPNSHTARTPDASVLPILPIIEADQSLHALSLFGLMTAQVRLPLVEIGEKTKSELAGIVARLSPNKAAVSWAIGWESRCASVIWP